MKGTQESQYSIGLVCEHIHCAQLIIIQIQTYTHLHYATSDWCVQADRRALTPDRLGWPMAQVLSRDQRN